MRRTGHLALGLLLAMAIVAGAFAGTAPRVLPATVVCRKSTSVGERLEHLQAAMAHGRFIAYAPTSIAIVDGKPTRPDAAAIRADLKTLRPHFDALVTYGAANGAEEIPAIAASLGFRALIIGLYDPFDAAELDAALAAARSQPALVVGVSLGNELLFFHKHSSSELEKLLDTVHRRVPSLPLTTTEPFHVYYEPSARPVLERMDFLVANVHPIFQPWFRSASEGDAAQFVVNVVTQLAGGYCGPILVKETGIPTAPREKGYTAQRQASFYVELQHRFPPTRGRAFAFFAAFDAPWRLSDAGPAPGQHPALEEAHWGLYDERRQPKAVIARIPPLTD